MFVKICAGIMLASGVFDAIWFAKFWSFKATTFFECCMILVASVIPAVYWSFVIHAMELVNEVRVYFAKDNDIEYELLYAFDKENVMVKLKSKNKDCKKKNKDCEERDTYMLISRQDLTNQKIYIEKALDTE